MPGKASDEDTLWDTEDEEAGEYVGCREAIEDLACMVLFAIFMLICLNYG